MGMAESRVQVAGSARTPMAGARAVGGAAQHERVAVTVRVRPGGDGSTTVASDLSSRAMPSRRYLSRAQLGSRTGADPRDIAVVRAFAKEHGLIVREAVAAERKVVLEGSAAEVSAAFEVRLERYEVGNRTYRGRTGTVSVPASLGKVVEGVFGLDDRQQAYPHFRVLGPAGAGDAGNGGIAAAAEPHAAAGVTPPQLAKAYQFPSDADGTGECIAIIELGGGFRRKDLTAYFASLGIPAPTVSWISVDGGRNQPSTADSADGEVMLDIEIAAAIAPKARIAVYFAPNTDRGFLDAITKAVHDTKRKPSVISISWGAAENGWTAQAMHAMDQAFADAALLGVSVLAASGDDGSDDRVGDGRAHADFPASSPHVTGCGGTRVVLSAGKISQERTWNDGAGGGATGGGVSDVFGVPAYQVAAKVPTSVNAGHRAGRGVPDVAGNASPASGYVVRVDGQNLLIGGTSAVAPLYAGLIALLNQKLGTPLGFANPLLYGQHAAGSYADITVGGNGAYTARAGWDACTGLGRIIGTRLSDALAKP